MSLKNDRKTKKSVARNTSERNVRLKAMFRQYLDQKNKVQVQPTQPIQYYGFTEAEKQKVAVKNIEEEEAEVFETVKEARPAVVIEKPVKLRWKTPEPAPAKVEETFPEAQRLMARRVLELLKRNNLLEYSCRRQDDVRVLYGYFKEAHQQPTPKIVELIDVSIGNGLDQIVRCSDSISDVIEDDMRQFLMGSDQAKRVLLDTMLQQPQYVPNAWGGSYCVKRAEEKQKSASLQLLSAGADKGEKTAVDDDVVEQRTREDSAPNTSPGTGDKDKEKDKDRPAQLEQKPSGIFESKWTQMCHKVANEVRRKEKEKEKEDGKDKEKDKEKEKEKEKDREKKMEKAREKENEREKEKERDREKKKEKAREKEEEKEKKEKERKKKKDDKSKEEKKAKHEKGSKEKTMTVGESHKKVKRASKSRANH